MKFTARALRLMMFIGEDEMWHHRPVHHEIVRRANDAGLAGASVFHGIEGFGAGADIHTYRILALAQDLPIVILIIDEEQRIRSFLPQLDELITEGLFVIDEVETIRYTARGDIRHP